jgi:hypothetical protein
VFNQAGQFPAYPDFLTLGLTRRKDLNRVVKNPIKVLPILVRPRGGRSEGGFQVENQPINHSGDRDDRDGLCHTGPPVGESGLIKGPLVTIIKDDRVLSVALGKRLSEVVSEGGTDDIVIRSPGFLRVARTDRGDKIAACHGTTEELSSYFTEKGLVEFPAQTRLGSPEDNLTESGYRTRDTGSWDQPFLHLPG